MSTCGVWNSPDALVDRIGDGVVWVSSTSISIGSMKVDLRSGNDSDGIESAGGGNELRRHSSIP
jgi:hypothetical protein